MHLAKSFLVVVGAALFFACSAAGAWDRQIYPGSMCHPDSYYDAPSFSVSTVAASNVGNGPMTVTCPIIRDNTSNLTGTSQACVRVQSAGSQLLTCTLVSRDEFGKSVASQSDSTWIKRNHLQILIN
jgi:hypothetical protein